MPFVRFVYVHNTSNTTAVSVCEEGDGVSVVMRLDQCIPGFMSPSTERHKLLFSNTFSLTWLVHVLRLRVCVCSVADGGFVGVGGELMIQLLWAVDKNGQTLHLVTGRKYLQIYQNAAAFAAGKLCLL